MKVRVKKLEKLYPLFVILVFILVVGVIQVVRKNIVIGETIIIKEEFTKILIVAVSILLGYVIVLLSRRSSNKRESMMKNTEGHNSNLTDKSL